MQLKPIWHLIWKSVQAWVDDYAPSMGAALAYYTHRSGSELPAAIVM